MDELYAKPGHLFRRMQQIAVATFMEECAAFAITPVQYAALVAIGEFPGIDATRLSAAIAFDRSTLGSVLDRLESKRYVLRRPSPEDRRIKLLDLSPAGRELLDAVGPAVDAAQARMLAALRPAEQRVLLDLLDRLVESNNDASRPPLRLPAAAE